MGAQPKHITEAEAADRETKETCISASDSEEMAILSSIVFAVDCIGLRL